MALPTITKTWTYDVNNPGAAYSAANWQTWFYNLKESFIAAGWSVAGSGGAGAGGGGDMDAVDRWVASTDIDVTGGGSGDTSWTVLQNNAIRTGFQVMLVPRNNAGGWAGAGMRIELSPGGNFTGGGLTTLPTASDQIAMVNTSVNAASNPEVPIWHFWYSSDSELTRVVWSFSGANQGFMLFDKPANAVSGWTDPWVAAVAYPGTLTTYANMLDGTSYARSSVGSTTMPLYLTSEGWNSAAAGERLTYGNDLDGGAYSMAPIGIACETAGVRGRHGELVDIWWASTLLDDGAHYPDSLPRQFVQVGDLILPWDTTAGQIQRV